MRGSLILSLQAAGFSVSSSNPQTGLPCRSNLFHGKSHWTSHTSQLSVDLAASALGHHPACESLQLSARSALVNQGIFFGRTCRFSRSKLLSALRQRRGWLPT
ncbi:MAG: hypothetical protein MI923_17720 [Phycisphaerales bacterium]|nr:hypothetical protein [Phycisphaerales bacterium]